MFVFLVVLSGLCWTIVYLELIRKGFKDKTYGMPLFALGLNFAWEVLYSIDGLFINKAFIPAQNVANVVWAVFDIAILVTYFMYGKKYYPERAKKYFVSYSIVAILSSVAMQLAFYLHIDNVIIASQYSAFAQNAAMSVLFLVMLFQREDTKGQSMIIAVAKMIGTLAPTILGGFIESFNIYIILMGGVTLVFDIVYIVLLYKRKKEEKTLLLNETSSH